MKHCDGFQTTKDTQTELNAARKEQLDAAFKVTAAIAEAIRELGQVPSGTLYAVVMGKLDFPTYERIIETLVRTGVVSKAGDVLRWIGDEPKAVR